MHITSEALAMIAERRYSDYQVPTAEVPACGSAPSAVVDGILSSDRIRPGLHPEEWIDCQACLVLLDGALEKRTPDEPRMPIPDRYEAAKKRSHISRDALSMIEAERYAVAGGPPDSAVPACGAPIAAGILVTTHQIRPGFASASELRVTCYECEDLVRVAGQRAALSSAAKKRSHISRAALSSVTAQSSTRPKMADRFSPACGGVGSVVTGADGEFVDCRDCAELMHKALAARSAEHAQSAQLSVNPTPSTTSSAQQGRSDTVLSSPISEAPPPIEGAAGSDVATEMRHQWTCFNDYVADWAMLFLFVARVIFNDPLVAWVGSVFVAVGAAEARWRGLYPIKLWSSMPWVITKSAVLWLLTIVTVIHLWSMGAHLEAFLLGGVRLFLHGWYAVISSTLVDSRVAINCGALIPYRLFTRRFFGLTDIEGDLEVDPAAKRKLVILEVVVVLSTFALLAGISQLH